MTEDREQAESPRKEQLSERQKMLLARHLEEPDIRKAAKEAGIGRTTLYRWLNEPAFRSALDIQRYACYMEALAVIRISANKAIQTMNNLLDSENEEMRRKASNDILTHTLRSYAVGSR
jgi:hypothetical protein